MTAAPDLPPRAAASGWDKAFSDIRSETRRWATRLARNQAPLTASEAARLRSLLTTLQGIADVNVAQMTAWGIDRAALSIRQDILLLQKAIPEWAVQTAQGTAQMIGWKNVPNMPAIAQIAQSRVIQMTADFTRLLPEIQDRLTATLTQAVATGEGPARMAQRLQAALDDAGQFGQGRAVMISRTTLASAYDGANQALYQQAAAEGIVYGWRWLAEPGACPVCRALDGTVFPVTQNTNRHPNCRCDMLPVFPEDADAVPYGQRYDPEPGTEADFERLELVTSPSGYTNWRLAPETPTPVLSGPRGNSVKALSVEEARGVSPFMTLPPGPERAATFFAESYEGQQAVMTVLRNRAAGRPDLDGIDLDRGAFDWMQRAEFYDDARQAYTQADLTTDILASADQIATDLQQATATTRSLYRGMRVDDPAAVFKPGDIIDLGGTSASPSRTVADLYTRESPFRQGDSPVVMEFRPGVKAADVDQGRMKFGQAGSDEHLVIGKGRIVEVRQDNGVWIVVVQNA